MKNFIEKAKAKFGDKFDYSKVVYSNKTTPVNICCPVHGWWSMQPTLFLQSKFGCPKCALESRTRLRSLGTDEIKKRLIEIHGDKYDYSRITATSRHSTVEIGCKEHGWVTTNLANLLRGQNGCIFCKGKNISASKSGLSTLLKAIKERGSNYTYDTATYVNYLTPMRIVCEKHGEFWQTPGNHFHQGQNCPSCTTGYQVSKGEVEVAEFLQSLGVRVDVKNRTVIAPKELDIFLPDFNIAVEYHGLHWHADDRKGTSMRKKWEMCQDKNVRLIQILEDEWLGTQGVIKDLLRAAVGMRERIYARNLTVAEIDAKTCTQFLENHHVSGNAPASCKLGMFSNEVLVGVMTLAKPRFMQGDFEVVRFATSKYVVGGFEKMLKYVVSKFKPKTIVSYADLRLGTGDSYVRAGFKDFGVTEPDYWWFKQRTRLSRYMTQKSKLRVDTRFASVYDDNLSEADICVAAGYRKISGVGHRRMVLQTNA